MSGGRCSGLRLVARFKSSMAPSGTAPSADCMGGRWSRVFWAMISTTDLPA